MKRILFIAEQAFPIRSSECICNSKVAYVLAEAGYIVDVFTYTHSSTYTSDRKIDSMLRNSKNLNVYEINPTSQQIFLSHSHSLWKNIKSALQLIYMGCKIGYLYNGMSSAYDILYAIKKHEKSFNGKFPYDVVVTRAYCAELAAIYLKEKYNIKWIANWNDPYPTCRFPKPYGNGINAKINIGFRKAYNKVKQKVDIHTFPSERLRDYMVSSFKTVHKSKTAVIPHMACSFLLPNRNTKHDKCIKFISCGSVSSPRNPTLFIMALKNVVDEMNLTSKDIKCYFVGKYDPFLFKIIKENNLEDIVMLIESMPYADCLDFIATCDISLIIEAQCEEGIYLPTKFADAVQCRIPVFCVSPKIGTLHDLVNEYHNGYVCNNELLESIIQALKQSIMDYRNGTFPIISKSDMEYFFEDDIIKKFDQILK